VRRVACLCTRAFRSALAQVSGDTCQARPIAGGILEIAISECLLRPNQGYQSFWVASVLLLLGCICKLRNRRLACWPLGEQLALSLSEIIIRKAAREKLLWTNWEPGWRRNDSGLALGNIEKSSPLLLHRRPFQGRLFRSLSISNAPFGHPNSWPRPAFATGTACRDGSISTGQQKDARPALIWPLWVAFCSINSANTKARRNLICLARS